MTQFPITPASADVLAEHFRQAMAGEHLGAKARSEAQRTLDAEARRRLTQGDAHATGALDAARDDSALDR